MLLVIKENNKEHWEDHYEWVERVYDIPASKEEIKEKYYAYMDNKFLNSGLKVNYNNIVNDYVNIFLSIEHYNVEEYGMTLCNKKDQKLFDKIIKENNFYMWLENEYNIKPILFEEIHLSF